jgi:hypothetical protein
MAQGEPFVSQGKPFAAQGKQKWLGHKSKKCV